MSPLLPTWIDIGNLFTWTTAVAVVALLLLAFWSLIDHVLGYGLRREPIDFEARRRELGIAATTPPRAVDLAAVDRDFQRLEQKRGRS